MAEAKCKCGKSKMNFQNLELEEVDGKWECEQCPAEKPAKKAAEPKVEAPKAEPKAESKPEEKAPRARKAKESPKQDGEKQ